MQMSVIFDSINLSNKIESKKYEKLKRCDSNKSFSSTDSKNYSNTKEDSDISEKNLTIFPFIKNISEILLKLTLQDNSTENETFLKENKKLLKVFDLKNIPNITLE